MKNGCNNITPENKKILEQKNVNPKSKLYFFLLILSLVNPISDNNSTYYSKIKVVFRGKKIISILNQNFYSKLSNVLINGYEVNAWEQIPPQSEGENRIELRFKEQIESCSGMFYNSENIIEIDLSNFDASKVKDISMMFYGCSNLENVEFGNISTPSLENMFALFAQCNEIKSLDLSHFDLICIILNALFAPVLILLSDNLHYQLILQDLCKPFLIYIGFFLFLIKI